MRLRIMKRFIKMINKSICVIGGGPAGLCAAKLCRESGYDVTVYEQTSRIGGTWVYSEKTGCHSSMYEVMQTNLPKEVMAFHNIPFPDNLKSFVDHQDVLKYIEDYGKDVPVQLNTRVESVERNGEMWQVTVEKEDGSHSAQTFRAVFVSTGHYFEPHNPFDTSKFEGTVIHSHDYRSNRQYSGKSVTVIGAGPSGIDIALQVAETADKVSLVGHCKGLWPGLPSNLHQISHNVTSLDGHDVHLDNGTVVPSDDVIICTGYLYRYPFFSPSLLSCPLEGRMVAPVYEHILHQKYPSSLFFLGLNFTVVPFILFETQVKYALSVLQGSTQIPSEAEMEQWHEDRLKELAAKGLPERMYHILADDQWDYFDRIAGKGGFSPLYTPVVRKLYDFVGEQRKINVADYKQINFTVDGDDFAAVL